MKNKDGVWEDAQARKFYREHADIEMRIASWITKCGVPGCNALREEEVGLFCDYIRECGKESECLVLAEKLIDKMIDCDYPDRKAVLLGLGEYGSFPCDDRELLNKIENVVKRCDKMDEGAICAGVSALNNIARNTTSSATKKMVAEVFKRNFRDGAAVGDNDPRYDISFLNGSEEGRKLLQSMKSLCEGGKATESNSNKSTRPVLPESHQPPLLKRIFGGRDKGSSKNGLSL